MPQYLAHMVSAHNEIIPAIRRSSDALGPIRFLLPFLFSD